MRRAIYQNIGCTIQIMSLIHFHLVIGTVVSFWCCQYRNLSSFCSRGYQLHVGILASSCEIPLVDQNRAARASCHALVDCDGVRR